MWDDALAWKIAFGVLVLAFCGVAYVDRMSDAPARATVTAIPPPAAPDPTPLPAAGPPPPLEPAPADIPEAQEQEVRVRTTVREPAPAKPHRAIRHTAVARLHFVRATHKVAARARQPSPYVAGRKHYPFDPRERDHWRERNT